jgi:hypothetical protein
LLPDVLKGWHIDAYRVDAKPAVLTRLHSDAADASCYDLR